MVTTGTPMGVPDKAAGKVLFPSTVFFSNLLVKVNTIMTKINYNIVLIATRNELYEVIEILIEYGFDSSMNKDFVIAVFSQGHVDICDLFVSNGFPFIFQYCVTACIYHSGRKTNRQLMIW